MVTNVITYDGHVYYGFQAVVIGFVSAILAYVRTIFKQNKTIIEELLKMSATQAQLDAAIQQEVLDVNNVAQGVSTLATEQATAFADLNEKIAANPTGDFTSEIATLSSNHTTLAAAASALASALTAAQVADPGPSQTTQPVTGA